MSTYDKDIEAYWAERMPEEIKKLFDKAINDLYSGPSYYDEDDNEVSCFDEGAIPFNFRAACRAITYWCDENMVPLYLETWSGYLECNRPEGDEPYLEWDEQAQKKILFGELAACL